MPFKLNAYLPSKQTEVQIKELSYKQYRELVKSLYNVSKKETIQQYNSILEDLCPDIVGKNIAFEDKLSLLITVRNYCVSPDLKLKGTLSSGETFNHALEVDTLQQLVNTINKSKTISYNAFEVSFSSYKIKDEYVFSNNNYSTFVVLASYIDNIKVDNEAVDFKDLTLEERVKIVEYLPQALVSLLQTEITNIEAQYDVRDLLVVKNPLNGNIMLRLSCNITYSVMQKLIELLYSENLNNVYRAFYNIVNYAGFSAEYIDSITPSEMQVYWMYFMQDREKSKEASGSREQSTPAGSLGASPSSEFGF